MDFVALPVKPAEGAGRTRTLWKLVATIGAALRGPGWVLTGPSAAGAQAHAVMFAGPGVLLRTPATSAAPYSEEGWRRASWYRRADGSLPRFDECRPDEHVAVSLREVLDYVRDQQDAIRLEEWAQQEAARAIGTWLSILRVDSTASVNLRRGALDRLENALMDAAACWGDAWVAERSSVDVQATVVAARQRLADERDLLPSAAALPR